MIAQVANDPGFDGVGCGTPYVGGGGKYVKAARMREAQFLRLDFGGMSLVSWRKSDICGERKERGSILSGVKRGWIGHHGVGVVRWVK